MGGLSVANVLHRLGALVTVLEYYTEGFHNRGGALGGVDTHLLQSILPNSSTSNHVIKGHGHFYGDLWQYLYDGLPEQTVQFGIDID